MLKSEIKEQLMAKVYELLAKTGLSVENDEMVAVMLEKGCQNGPDGRVRIPRKLIEEMAQYQKKTQKQDEADQELHYLCGIDWAHHIIWHNRQDEILQKLKNTFLMSAFDCGPTKYYDKIRHVRK